MEEPHHLGRRGEEGVDAGGEVVACADVDAGRAEWFAGTHGIPAAVTSIDALLDLGVHVLCEKPIAVDLPSARRMTAACDAAGVTLGVLFSGGSGRPRSGSAPRSPPGSAPALVSGPGGTADVAEYPEGAEGANDVWAVPGLPDAMAVRSPFGAGLTGDVPLSAINGSLVPFHTRQIAEFVDAVRAGREPAVTGREATKSLAILTALHASARSGRPERVPSLKETFA